MISEVQPRNPIARLSDPSTSHLAAAQVTASGLRDRQAVIVLDLVRRFAGCTSAELAARSEGEIDRYVTARRLPELEHLGLVYRAGIKSACRVTGKAALTWWAVREGVRRANDAR